MNMPAPAAPSRFQAIIVPLMVASLLIAGLWLLYQNERSYRAEQVRITRVQAEILAASVTAAVDFRDRASAQEAVNALRVSSQIQSAGVYDVKGERFAGYQRSDRPLPPTLSRARQSVDKIIEVTIPVIRSGTKIGTVYLASLIDPLSRRLTRYAIIALLIVMTSLVLGLLGYNQAVLREVNSRLQDQAGSLAVANRELQFQMEERARAEEQLRQAQKMQALGQLTGGIAHDFNNMLTVIQGSADLLRRPGLSEEKRLRFAGAIVDTAARAALLTGQLLAFARRQPLRPEVLDINQRIRGMVNILEPSLGIDIKLVTDLQDGLWPVEVDPGQLEATLLNIVMNSRDAMPEGGTITIRTRNASSDAGGENKQAISVVIEDTGLGMDVETVGHVFEPFFTTKTVGKGTGLGLSQVYGFAAQSGGEVRLTSQIDKGTIVTIMLPRTDKRPITADLGASRLTSQGGGGVVLLVEDNAQVGNFAEALLGELGHSVLRAHDAQEALKLVQNGASFDVVFTDVVMPGMNGIELADTLRRDRPELPIVLTTGYSDRIVTTGSPGYPVITKPYRLESLAAIIDQALAAAA